MIYFLNKNKYYLLFILISFLFVINNSTIFIFQNFSSILYFIILAIPFVSTYFLTNSNTDTKNLKKILEIVENPFQFSILLFLFVFICLQSIYNQKILSPYGFETSIFNGYFTLATALPISDNYGYFSDINLFLDLGKIQGCAIYRPLSSLFLGSVYKLCGRNFELYSSVINLLLVFSICVFSKRIKKYFGIFVCFLSAFILCIYAGLFLNTFLTEIPGLMLGLIAFSLLLDGFITLKLKYFYAGFILLCLAFQLRSGMELFLFLFTIAFLFFLRKKINVTLLNSFVLVLILISSFFATQFILILLTENNNSVSNLGFFVYKIYKNAETWDFIYTDYPQISTMSLIDQSAFVKNIAIKIIKDDFFGFVINYLKYALKNINIIPQLLYPFYFLLPYSFNNLLFFLFFITPIFNKGKLLFFYYLSIILVVAIFLSIPVIKYVELRVLAVVMPLQVLIYVVAFNTFLKIITNTLFLGSKYWNEFKDILTISRIKRIYFLPKSISISDVEIKESKLVLIATTTFIFFILFSPVLIDRLRKNSTNQVSFYNNKGSVNNTFYLFPKNAIWKKVTDENQFPKNNHEVPLHVFMSNNPIGIKIPTNTYVFSSFYYLNNSQKSCQAVFVNEKLFKAGFNIESTYKLNGKIVNIPGGLGNVFLTDSVLIN